MRKKQWLAALLAGVLLCSALPRAEAAGMNSRHHIAACGTSHTLAVKDNGSVWVWGSNQDFQLGLPGAGEAKVPTELKNMTAVSVAAGSNFSAALRYDGTVYQWGYHRDEEPVQVPGLSGVEDIVAGQSSLLALKRDGTVWMWSYGETPEQVQGLPRISVIAAGGAHYLALTSTGDVWAWGANDFGQLGDGTQTARSTPVRVQGLFDVVDIAAGLSHSLAVTFQGTVYQWGHRGPSRQDTGPDSIYTIPTAVKGISGGALVSAGSGFSMAATEKGELYAWGYGEYGQLGQPSLQNYQSSPVKISSFQGAAQYIASGTDHSLAVNQNGKLFAWGRNRDFQLGKSTNANINTPESIFSSGTAKPERCQTGALEGLDSWAYPEVSQLYELNLVPPMLWDRYRSNITRAEMVHMLVSLHEQVNPGPVTVPKRQTFQDLDGHLLETDLRKGLHLKIISGTSSTTLEPDRLLTRQESAKMLCSFLSNLPGEKPPDMPGSLTVFQDAPQIQEWAAISVLYVYQNGIMVGDDTGCFRPNGSITRQEALLIIARLAVRRHWGAA